MDKLQLALLTKWAEDAGLAGIQGRKRMQKVIYFLQQAGFPSNAEYTLHHYGPYSREVANVTDVMVAQGLLIEQGGGGEQYGYRLAPQTPAMIEALRVRQASLVSELEPFQERALNLLKEDLWPLELGSTIHFYRVQNCSDWEVALQQACEYKRADPTSSASQKALTLAKQFEAAA